MITAETISPWKPISALTEDEARALLAQGILPDGYRARIPLTLMDAAPPIPIHDVVTSPPDTVAPRTHAGALTDAQMDARDQLYSDRDRIVSEAWRSPGSAFTPAAAPTLDATADIYDQRDHAASNAWRSPPAADPAIPAASPQPQQVTPQDRAQLYEARDRKLTEAWRNPQ